MRLQEFNTPKVMSNFQGMTTADYLYLHAPAVDWLCMYVGKECPGHADFTTILQKYNEHCKSSMVLKPIIDAFDPSHYIDKALAVVQLVKKSETSKTSTVMLLESLGARFATCPPPEEQRLQILNEVWKVVTRCDVLSEYVPCAAVWLDVLLQYYSDREVQILLEDVTRHVEQADPVEVDEVAMKLEHLVTIVIQHSKTGAGGLVTSEHLHKILDYMKSNRKVEICKDLLDSFAKNQESTNNPILINTIFDLSRTLHDSLDSLSPDGERKHIANLICGFIGKIDFKKDLEGQLNIMVEARAAFPNLDVVKDRLILSVAALATRAHFFMKARHTKKTSAFVKACLAYCHVTIPSIDDVFRRLELLLHCAQVALLNQCLPQTDTFLKASITLVPDVPTTEEVDYKRVSTEPRLATFLRSFLAFLVIVPGHPSHGPFYLVQGLLNALPRYEWNATSVYLPSIYIDMLGLISAYAQRKLPYSIERVESNDVLYGGSPDYMEELAEHRVTILEAIITQLTALRESEERAAKNTQATLVLQLVNQVSLSPQRCLPLSSSDRALCTHPAHVYEDLLASIHVWPPTYSVAVHSLSVGWSSRRRSPHSFPSSWIWCKKTKPPCPERRRPSSKTRSW